MPRQSPHGCALTCALLAVVLLSPVRALGVCWRIEAENARPEGSNRNPSSSAEVRAAPLDEASNGAVLVVQGIDPEDESAGLAVSFAHTGYYRVWVRYRCPEAGKHCSFLVLLRDEDGEAVSIQKMDFVPRLPVERPYARPEDAQADHRIRESGWTWQAMPIIIERPLEGRLHFGSFRHGGSATRTYIDCAVVTDQEDFNPPPSDWRLVPAPAQPGQRPATTGAAAGLIPAKGFPMNSQFFAGVDDQLRQFKMGLSYNGALYFDHARFICLGFNRTHGLGGSQRYGIWMMRPADVFAEMDPASAAQHPAPSGRFVNAQGQAGTNWSLSFAPLYESLGERTRATLQPHLDDLATERWRIVSEVGGQLDYSEPARQEFRRWLAQRYGSIQRLNQQWGTTYPSFGVIEPAADPGHGEASWFAFRQFSGEVFARAVRRQVEAIRQIDQSGRELTEQLSNVDLLSPKFMSIRPLDWESLIDIALKDVDCIGWDAYSADDYQGCEIDLVHSLAGQRRLFNEEWNVHAADPRIAARTLWTMIGKGLRGVHCYQWQQGTADDSYPKWALLNGDFTPRAKLGAMADIAHEVHRLEPLLTGARRVEAVKPVALYYSTLDLALAKPLASPWGEAVDSPYHVYEALRSTGYAVRWITPSQIERGGLSEVSAVVLVDAQHIPRAAARALAEWVREGGAVIADGWPGALDEYGRPQSELAEVFAVAARRGADPAPTTQDRLALEQSTQGYGEVTINALQGDDLPSTVGEIWQQWDSTHPVARAMGNYTLSGYGLKRVRCTAGQVIGMTFGGDPGIVVNDYGRGHAMYAALMLGSLYEGAATRYEWDSSHSGLAYIRVLDELLRFAGAEPAASADGLAPSLRSKLRVESPLIDQKGNALIALSSMNDQPLGGFRLRLSWPEDVPLPGQMLFVRGGQRSLEPLKFETRGKSLVVDIPAFDTHAALLALRESDPLVGLQIEGATRGTAGLLMLQPGARLMIKATVHNPSPAAVPAGEVQLWAPRGWLIDAEIRPCPAIEPWGQATIAIQVQAPGLGGQARLRPLVVKHRGNGKTSTPATEMLWWNRPADSRF